MTKVFLSLCPFCGGDEARVVGFFWFYVECPTCMSRGPAIHHSKHENPEQAAKDLWAKRPMETALKEAINSPVGYSD
jgi:hypothetical protein